MGYVRKILRKIKPVLKKSAPRFLLAGYRRGKNALKRVFNTQIKTARDMLRFEIHVCEHCNLNCKGCGHFSPLAKKHFLDPAVFERDCRQLSKLSNRRVELIDLMGGEPLLHPQITKIFEIARMYFDDTIQLVTNGILLEKQNDVFWESCRRQRIDILISRYPYTPPGMAERRKDKLQRKKRRRRVVLYARRYKRQAKQSACV
jgi:uncharacterized radical SAM superfamily Fe-S cluster-containing enzyme